jgi:hypothetical protein
MTEHYFKSRKEADWASRFSIDEAGLAAGSLGMPRMLIVLRPKQPNQDRVLLDFKQVYRDPDTAHFFNPYVHHGLRMIEASFLHAPGVEQRLGFLTWRESQYWVRAIPPFKGKIKGDLSDETQVKLARAVGLQLGRAHRLSLRETHPDELVRHLVESMPTFVSLAEQMNREVQDEFVALHGSAESGSESKERSKNKKGKRGAAGEGAPWIADRSAGRS